MSAVDNIPILPQPQKVINAMDNNNDNKDIPSVKQILNYKFSIHKNN